MVRPIEITDSLSKVEIVERMQNLQKLQPEAAQQFQKTLNEKLTTQVTTPNPVSKSDQVVIHADEREREKERQPGGERHDHHDDETEEQPDGRGSENADDSHGHIDVKV